ncbi:enoyl-CoA hydratase-related protein [Aneurinibacillus sp. Ricciae_BoGa-3]|uniref:enoyl-CoA hydratase/isomerase family protein n=1 Tax=Aneurinibacillus sp. Ricciae_BoGa-3 TaxID=3022697 RepID=UPI00233FA878|nr:enoyl-CoA hydratase-related protein [Aneurinibacillus sp. Ricciae_BoGa-3]WCK56361.1 enoyl-CoA hydratase-related protein [Aneurinibacillus sp. Ricciae_BoGa-3]
MSDLLFAVENGVARITLNRPDKLNAFSTEMIHLWINALETIRDNEEIRVVVLTGNGRAFCSGGDIKSMARGEGFLSNNNGSEDFVSTALARKNSLWKKVQRIPLLMQEIDKPVIAVIHGSAMGAGLDMALMCDIRIAAESAKLAESYVKAGIVPGDGGAYFLPRIVGVDKALEMLWHGDTYSAEEAKQLGLVTHVIPDEKMNEFVEAYIQRTIEGPKEVLRFIKRAVYQGLAMDLRSSLDMISSTMGIVTELEDYQEGVKAIMDKRKPKFN